MIVGGQSEHSPRLAACVPDDVEPDTCVSVVASLREEFASRFAGDRPLAVDFKLFTTPLTFPWVTPLLPADGVGGAGCGRQAIYHPFDSPVGPAPAPCRWSWWSWLWISSYLPPL